MSNNRYSQRKRILHYLHIYGSITRAEAFTHLGITELSSRVGEINDEGEVRIISSWESGTNVFGEPIRYKRYRVAEVNQ